MTALTQQTGALFAGPYRLGRLHGRGGMADVYASVDARTGTPVAVKVFRDSDFGGAERRSAEVATLSALRHPNLVELLDAGNDEGREFLVMALVEGPTLTQECRSGLLPLARTAQIGAAVADALAYVHAGDVVHRDVKPDNVLLGPGPRVRLADFGIARGMAATRITQSGLVMGTAGYLAPEQVTGDEVAAAADVYALGLVLLECLTGHREYLGTAFESALARLHRCPQLPPDLPAGWAALLKAMTATDPASRPCASSAAAALHQLAADPKTSIAAVQQAIGAPLAVPAAAAAAAAPAAAPGPAAPPPPPAPLPPPAASSSRPAGSSDAGRRRHRRLLALAAATVVVLTPGGIVGERALLSDSSARRPPAGNHGAAVAAVPALPFTPSADVPASDAGARPSQVAQMRRAAHRGH